MSKNLNVEAEGGELILANESGDHVIIPKRDRSKVKGMLNKGHHSKIDSYVNTLPVSSDYAEDGTLVPSGQEPKVKTPKITNFEVRINDPNQKSIPSGDNDGKTSTHKMMSFGADGKYYAAPTIVERNGKLEELSEEDAITYALENNEYKEFKTENEASKYAEGGYKIGTPMEGQQDIPIQYGLNLAKKFKESITKVDLPELKVEAFQTVDEKEYTDSLNLYNAYQDKLTKHANLRKDFTTNSKEFDATPSYIRYKELDDRYLTLSKEEDEEYKALGFEVYRSENAPYKKYENKLHETIDAIRGLGDIKVGHSQKDFDKYYDTDEDGYQRIKPEYYEFTSGEGHYSLTKVHKKPTGVRKEVKKTTPKGRKAILAKDKYYSTDTKLVKDDIITGYDRDGKPIIKKRLTRKKIGK